MNPFWSPDGGSIGFFAQGKLRKVALDGGVPQNICTTSQGMGGSWSRSGEIVFSPDNRAALMRVSAAGGTPQPLTALDASRHENSHRWPSFLPDGRHFLFTARSNEKENTAIYVGSLDSKETIRLLTEQSNAAYAAPGYLLFGRDGTLMAQRFDRDTLKLSGEAFPVAGNIDQETPSANAFLSLSGDGSVVTFHEASKSLDELTWVDRAGKPQGVIGTKGLYGWPRLSPDGKRVAVWMPDPDSGNRDIWIIDVSTGTRNRLTLNPANDWFPEWSPDGSYVTYASDRTTPPSVYRKAASGEGDEELVVPLSEKAWLPGGIGVPAFAESRPGSFSRKDNWVAYQSTKSGTREIYVRSLDRAEEHRISASGGAAPRWRGDGKELFFLTPDNGMMAVEVSLKEPFTSGSPRQLFRVCSARRSSSLYPDYEVTPDGHRFLFPCQSQEVRKRSIAVAIRWLDMIKNPNRQ
jgi:Tol biopolymer transport system component